MAPSDTVFDTHDDIVDVYHLPGDDLPPEMRTGTDCYVPPVDHEFWIAVIHDDIVLGTPDKESLEHIVDTYINMREVDFSDSKSKASPQQPEPTRLEPNKPLDEMSDLERIEYSPDQSYDP